MAAADLDRHGLTGPPTVLEGRFGFLQALCGDRAHPDAVVRGLGTDWELPRVVFKPYPCNHFTHAGVDAALRLRAQGLAPADVTAIELGVAKPVLRTIAEPPEAKARPGPPGTTRRSAAPTRSPRRCSAAASACPTRTSPTPPPVTPAASRALFTIPRWGSTAPLGKPVVPEVYWICAGACGLTSGRSPSGAASAQNASQSANETTSRSAGRSPRTCCTISAIALPR